MALAGWHRMLSPVALHIRPMSSLFPRGVCTICSHLALLSTPDATSAESTSATRRCTRVSGRNSMDGGMASAFRNPATNAQGGAPLWGPYRAMHAICCAMQ